MPRKSAFCALAGLLVGASALPAAGQNSNITYQGHLKDAGNGVNGLVDVSFSLYDAQSGGNQVGTTQFAEDVDVVDGLFSTEVDFGAGAFGGGPRWLEIAIARPAGGSYTTLTPRQAVTAAPYALYALDGPGSGVTPWQLNSGDVYYNGGSVGIGTNTPSGALEAVGGVRSSGPGSGFFVFNPNNPGASAHMSWLNDTARIRVGGSGAGANGGFSIQRIGDQTLFRVTDNRRVGIIEEDPLVELHVTGESIGLLAGALENDEIIVEAQDAVMGLYSTSQGDWGSAISLKEVSGGNIVDTWGIARQTTTGNSNLFFTYGPSNNYAVNPSVMMLGANGNVGIGTTAAFAKMTVQVDNPGSSAVSGQNTSSSGNAGNFGCSDPANSDTALLAIHAGAGKAFLAYNYGTGPAAEVTIDNPASSAPSLRVTNSGSGSAVEAGGIVHSTSGGFRFPDGSMQTTAATGGGGGLSLPFNDTVVSSSTAFSVTNDGNGRAAYFESTSDGESLRAVSFTNDSAVTAINNGTGSAGFFQNFGGTANTVTVSSFADGKALNVLQLGDGGPAGHFEVNNVASGQPAIRAVVTNGDGYAIDAEGRIRTHELEITGGADLSEQFDIDGAGAAIEPGMVVCIDATNPGKLTISRRAYDPTVAGIVSGAGGVKPGMLMGQKGTKADGEHPVALTGRVYVRVTTDNGPVQPGDMLTTSDTPGVAMKATDRDRAFGSTIGKAMSSLESGEGLVLVLVNLQ